MAGALLRVARYSSSTGMPHSSAAPKSAAPTGLDSRWSMPLRLPSTDSFVLWPASNAVRPGDPDAEREVQRQVVACRLVGSACAGRLLAGDLLAEGGERLLERGAAAQVEERPVPRLRRLLQSLRRRRDADAVERQRRARPDEPDRKHGEQHSKTLLHVVLLSRRTAAGPDGRLRIAPEILQPAVRGSSLERTQLENPPFCGVEQQLGQQTILRAQQVRCYYLLHCEYLSHRLAGGSYSRPDRPHRGGNRSQQRHRARDGPTASGARSSRGSRLP
jgi:hypothetical protein